MDNWEIYVMDADGNNQRNLTNHPALDSSPSWSPEGKIGFSSSRDGSWNIYMMDADGGNVTQLTHHKAEGGSASAPNWSPDGKQIAFTQSKWGLEGQHGREIYILNVLSGVQRRLTVSAPSAPNFKPRWSPDGTQILYYVAINARMDNARLMVTDKEGIHHEQVPLPDWNLSNLSNGTSWSPSGREIIFPGREEDGNWEIYRFHLKTHKLTNLTNRLGADIDANWWNSNLPVEPKDVHITRWGHIKSGGP